MTQAHRTTSREMMAKNRRTGIAIAVIVSASLAGCGSSTLSIDPGAATGVSKGEPFTGPKVDAGLPVPATAADSTQFTKLVATNSRKFHARTDPFALSSDEKSFDASQASERVFNSIGGFPTYVHAEEMIAPTVAVEQQPYRRLSGIVVGDSVVAIIDMGNGQSPALIRPGEKIPNSPWTVVSIDQDRAVLRRSGDVLPKEIEVRLETPPGQYAVPPPTNPGGPGGGGQYGPPGSGGAPGGGGGSASGGD